MEINEILDFALNIVGFILGFKLCKIIDKLEKKE